MHVNWNVRIQKRSETAVWTVLMGCAPTLPPPRDYYFLKYRVRTGTRRAAPRRRDRKYRTFKFSFQVRIRHRYVKKIIWIAHPARSLTLQGKSVLKNKNQLHCSAMLKFSSSPTAVARGTGN